MSEPARDERGRWRPGYSGNPRGRPPKGQALSEHLRNVLAEEVETVGGCRVTRARLLAKALVERATAGDMRAARLVLEHVDGKPAPKRETQDQDHETHGQDHEANGHEAGANVEDKEALDEWIKNLQFSQEDIERLMRGE